MQLSGVAGSPPPLRRIPLFADGLEECLPDRLRQLAEDVTADDRASS
jgi:ABC-type sugar transport system substrate-binding protein